MSRHPFHVEMSDRLRALSRAVDLVGDRADAELVGQARALLTRAEDRTGRSGEQMVVALAGATGSGKSSLFNALVGLEVSAVGVRRPTTDATFACTWEPAGAAALLDWLGVPGHRRIARDSELDSQPHSDLDGLVLLDLPDHDSTHQAHEAEVDRVLRMVDLVVWVTDPQKYADASVHHRYLRRHADRESSSLVVLNKVDQLSGHDAAACLADLRRLVAEDGLGDVAVVGASAAGGAGIEAVRGLLMERLATHRAAADRLADEVGAVASRLAELTGPSAGVDLAPGTAGLLDEVADATGVPGLAQDAHDRTLLAGLRMTSWPPVRRRYRSRTHTGARPDASGAGGDSRLTLVSPARAELAVRSAVEGTAAAFPRGWADAVRDDVARQAGDLTAELGRTVGRVDLDVGDVPRGWRLARFAHWVLLVGALAGIGCAGALAVLIAERGQGAGRLAELAVIAALATVGCLLAGVALAASSRRVVRVDAEERRRAVDAELRAALSQTITALVLDPLAAERTRHREAAAAIARARAGEALAVDERTSVHRSASAT